MHRHCFVRSTLRLATLDEISFPDSFGYRGKRKVIKREAHVATWVAILKAARKYLVQCSSGNYAKLA